MRNMLVLGIVLVSVTMSTSAYADEDWTPISTLACEPETDVLSPTRYLRALTFDLAGRPPTVDEFAQVKAEGVVSDAVIDALLENQEFATQATRFHGSFLWNNVSSVSLTNNNYRLNRASNIYWRRNPARVYRGDTIPCLEQPAHFDQDGRILPISGTLEGYVEVEPYWLPAGETVRVCAYDAQATLVSSSGVRCDTTAGANDAECGCGPNMSWCSTGTTNRAFTDAMSASLERFVYSVFERGEPYSALFDSRRAYINGPLSHFFRNLVDVRAGITIRPLSFDLNQTPELEYVRTENWYEYLLPDHHAGFLTQPAFLLRFQTNRARANRFYDAFLCNGFQAPDGGLPVADEGDALNPDLQKRAGCQYCHARLEPAAAHWGRWSEQGIGYLNTQNFPVLREDCLRCAQTNQGCNNECRNFYHINQLSQDDQPYLGLLNAYRFLGEESFDHVELGPKRLAYTEIESNQLPHCIAKRTAEWLLGRSLKPDESNWRESLGRDFLWSDLNYRKLVKEIVTSDTYRRVR